MLTATLAIALGIAAMILAAMSSLEVAGAREASPRVSMAIWISDDEYAELCIDLRDPIAGRTRRCPAANRLSFARASEGRWLRSADLHIAPEVSIYARARRVERTLDYGLGVVIEGEARGLRARSWHLEWDQTATNQWVTSSTITLRLPVAPFPELWPVDSGIVTGAHRLEVGRGAPDFVLPVLGIESGGDDSLVSLSSARGGSERVTLIVFWSSWAPYVDEMLSVLSDLAARHDDLLVLGINIYETDRGAGEMFAHGVGTGIQHLVDTTGAVARHYRVDGVPELYVLDGNGIYRGVTRGPAPLRQILAVIDDAR